MTAPISSLCTAAASRACYNSRDIISKTANSIVGRCSGINHKRYPTHQIRYITENNDSNKSDGIDRSKFTNEVKVRMPDVGENNEALGVIQKWFKEEGDLIKQDDVICDIRTEMFTFGMLTDDAYDSIMGKILIPEESEPIDPGTIICTTLNEGIEEKEEEEEDTRDDQEVGLFIDSRDQK